MAASALIALPLLGAAPALTRTFSRGRAALRAERERGECRSGRRRPDLALFFTVDVPLGADPAAHATSLRALPRVESAEP